MVGEQVLLDIKTSHPLIGETWYVPQVRVTNSSNSSISVTGVELISRGGSYTNKPRRSGDYPLVVQPGQTEDLPIWFDLSDSVKKTFQQPAELRVHYRKDNKEGIAYATIVGGPLHVNGTS